MNKNIIYKRILMIALTILMILLELSFWPGYLAHDFFWSKSNSAYGNYNSPYAKGVSTTQYFIPQMSWLSGIDIVADFDENAVGNETLEFAIYDEKGKKIYDDQISIAEMQSGLYYTIPVKKKLKVGEQYYWTICATEDLPYDWRLMYSADKTGMASENTFVTSEGQQTFGEEQQTVSQYCYYTHKDKVIIIATCWCGSILIYLIILEIIQKIFRKPSADNEEKEKNHDL